MEAPSFPLEVNWVNLKEYLDGIISILRHSETYLSKEFNTIYRQHQCSSTVNEDPDSIAIQYQLLLQSLHESARSFEYFYELKSSSDPTQQVLISNCVDHLLQRDFVNLAHRILLHLSHLAFLREKTTYKALKEIYRSLIILAELSYKFTNSLATHKDLRYLVLELICLVRIWNPTISEKKKRIEKVMEISLRISVHILLTSGLLSFFIPALSWKLALQEVLVVEQEKELQFLSRVSLAFLSCEKNEAVANSGELLSELLDMVHLSREDPTHTINKYTAEMYLRMVEALVTNYPMKLALWRHKSGVQLLMQITTEVHYPEESFIASKILCSMLLHEEIVQNENSNEKVNLLEHFKKPEPWSGAVRKTLDLAQRLLTGEDGKAETLPASSQPPVFISYCSADKGMVHKIWHRLEIEGVSCWIDVVHMKNSTINCMAEGIENARVVLLCMSAAYHTSYWGQMEACYAVKLRQAVIIPLIVQHKYKPHGWLGFILGDKLYYEFSERRDLEDTLAPLLRVIKTHI